LLYRKLQRSTPDSKVPMLWVRYRQVSAGRGALARGGWRGVVEALRQTSRRSPRWACRVFRSSRGKRS